MSEILKKMVAAFISKKRVIGWVSAVVIAFAAGALGMSTGEIKDAICSTPAIEPVKVEGQSVGH